jgi:hypothetical protein
MFLHHLKVIVYEVKHNILTDRMKSEFFWLFYTLG